MEEQILKQLAQPLLAWYDIHRRILPPLYEWNGALAITDA